MGCAGAARGRPLGELTALTSAVFGVGAADEGGWLLSPATLRAILMRVQLMKLDQFPMFAWTRDCNFNSKSEVFMTLFLSGVG